MELRRTVHMNSLITAIRTLTIFPIPGKDTIHFERSLFLFPVVGVLLSLIPLGVWWWAETIVMLDTLVPAITALGLVTWATGALHLDGLGDVADAFGGAGDREQVLAILKDSRMGSFGVTAIVFDLLLKTALWRIAFEQRAVIVIMCGLVMARCGQAILPAFMPNARGGGLAASFGTQGKTTRYSVIVATLLVLLCVVVAVGPLRAGVMTVAGGAALVIFARQCRVRIGGITGDCIGAANELIEVAVLAAAFLVV
ncbi:MAG: adenosylcobinamide-GDP ribazoletransferase [Chitinivibrionales bacterium]|nr:adenosylcobinamide-GDP ribazoletransferase [Chitinivibrionales bacterium]MBD3358904.1 adenosylcobinamide-GDP ribazoletransferase [Chitinivibrionales bacterium]